ncbi:MAG: pirin family protein [Prolixibacteraceae bacterium]|jgi:redox-sensitive bicupin YhaK (pirin superfamily)|nr:pirin family protein [Prolixibacteraceae bacterium]NLO04083.1 pirin family protein [Bacteroidales bacterium]
MNKRKAIQIVRGRNAIDGAGVHLRRVLGARTIIDFDPFLMLDGFDSADPEDYIKGFPWHPHRGIETITYLIKGKIEHGDSLGNKGTINDLECQWMTAGSGIIHQEMPKASERMLGCQIWVNLPAKDKMTVPAYGDITHDKIIVAEEENAVVRILAGTYKGESGVFEGKYVKVKYIDVDLAPDSTWTYTETPNSETLFIYLLDGTIAVDDNLSDFEDKSCAVLFASSDKSVAANDAVVVRSGKQGARFVLLAAKPLRETVAWGGPIVMNTNEELEQAYEELDNGTFIKHKV